MGNQYYDGPPSDHFDGVRFFHPGLPPSDKSLLEVLRWRFQGKRAPWPAEVPARSGVRPTERVAGLRITHVGHASYLLQVSGLNVLVDPVWSERASPLGWTGPRRHNAPAIAFGDLPPIDAVLLSHNHYDHMDTATMRRLWERDRPQVVTPFGNERILQATTPGMDVQTGDWWSAFPLDGGVRVTIVPAYHWSSRSLRDRRMALWGGFVLQTRAGVVYCAGDTAYRDGAIFREIAERFGPPSVAVLPIGAYAPRWFMSTQHADPEEAVQIARELRAKQVVGVHWGTFQLTDEPFAEPAERLEAATGAEPAWFQALRPGDTFDGEE